MYVKCAAVRDFLALWTVSQLRNIAMTFGYPVIYLNIYYESAHNTFVQVFMYCILD